MSGVKWTDWEDDPLAIASDEDRIVLLFLVSNWCRFCADMEEATFGDPRVVKAIGESFVPVKVDADRRPDVDSRFNMGGWPSVVFVSPEGELVAGENYLTATELLDFFDRVRDYYAKHRDEIAQGIKIPASTYELEAEAELDFGVADYVVGSMLEKFDHRYGGWGEGQKFAHPESIDFAMIQYAKTGDHRLEDVVVRTLDNMMEGAIHDVVDGGFFRFSTTPDWRVPHYEKVLDSNALRLRCFVLASKLFDKPAYRKAAEGIARWITTTMCDPETGAFYGSQGDDPDYDALDAEERKRHEPPSMDRTIYTNWNAMAIVSLFRSSVILEDSSLRAAAKRALQFLLENLYDERHGMYHYWDGTYHLPGVLSDQAYMIQALVTASQFAGNADLLLPAEHLVALLLETHRAPGGGFYDLPESVRGGGAMRKRNRSILENSVLAEALLRLSYLARRDEYRDTAREALVAFTHDYKEYGYFVAGYARTVDLILYEPMVVTVVGDRESDVARSFRTAAQGIYVPSRIVQTLDPAHDPILIERGGFPVEEGVRAYLSVGRTTYGVFEEPGELVEQMLEIEAQRRKAN